jgi:hypothetical protein
MKCLQSLDTPVFSTNKTDQDITEILLKVALNTISLAIYHLSTYFNLGLWIGIVLTMLNSNTLFNGIVYSFITNL